MIKKNIHRPITKNLNMVPTFPHGNGNENGLCDQCFPKQI